MAIWQFKIEFVPKSAFAGKTVLSEEEWHAQSWWRGRSAPDDYANRFSRILPPLKSWSKDLYQWGMQDGDLIEVWAEGDVVESISARIDCRNINPRFIRDIFQVADEWDCSLVHARDRSLLPDQLGQFIEAVWNSPHHRVLQAPEEWLPKLAKEVEDAGRNR